MTSFLVRDEPVLIWSGKTMLDGRMSLPENAHALVVMACTSGTFDHRGFRTLARRLDGSHIGSLLADLLTPREQQFDARTGHFRLDLPLLAERILEITRWLARSPETTGLPLALFASGAVGAAGLIVQAKAAPFFSVVLNSPRIDLATDAAASVDAPVLMITGKEDVPGMVGTVSDDARLFRGPNRISIVSGVNQALDRPQAATDVADRAVEWLQAHAGFGGRAKTEV